MGSPAGVLLYWFAFVVVIQMCSTLPGGYLGLQCQSVVDQHFETGFCNNVDRFECSGPQVMGPR